MHYKLLAAVATISIGYIPLYTQAQTSSEDVLNLLTNKKVLTQNEVDSIRADDAIKQQSEIKDKTFTIDLEVRPRTEFRDGFRALPNNKSIPGFFTSQRSRVGLNYKQDGVLNAQLSVQDVRVWGQNDPRSGNASIQLFEAYIEPYLTSNFSIRAGRQKLAFDNQRLFAENDWRVNANAHDAVNFRYYSESLISELALAFNQNAENNYGTAYAYKDPTGTAFQRVTYKYLGVHYFNYKITKELKLTTINAFDGYQDTTTRVVAKVRSLNSPERSYARYTNGGRLEYESNDFYATVAAYYQWGDNSKGQKINAWYIQPEVRYTLSATTIRLGAEVFSGRDITDKTNKKDNSFAPLYGVAHRFNGSLEYFTQQPGDVGNAGLVNPYLSIVQVINSKLSIKSDFHYFSLQNKYVNAKTNEVINKDLGFENDWILSYKANAYIAVDLGISYGAFTKSLEIIKNDGGSSAHTPVWSYLQLKVNPQLFKTRFR